jgi:hypothetical protein
LKRNIKLFFIYGKGHEKCFNRKYFVEYEYLLLSVAITSFHKNYAWNLPEKKYPSHFDT